MCMRKLNGITLVIASVLMSVLLVLTVSGFSYGQTCSYRIMPLGDSITRGVGSTDISGYRAVLLDFLSSDTAYGVDFMGSLNDGPETFDNDHEGHGGYTSSQVASNIFPWLQDNPAEIVLLHIGTNDFKTSITNVENILATIDQFSQDTWVVLAQIINQDPYSSAVSTFNDNLWSMAQRRILNGDKIIVVDQENALIYPSDLSDQLHPNDGGYAKMAQVWAYGLEPLLDELCSGPPRIMKSAVAPKTLGYINEPYSYQVRVYGDPVLLYELTSAPGGMTIDPATGAISWTPTAVGSFNVTVRVSNSFGDDTQSFTIVVTDPASEVIIDNGRPGTTPVGAWSVSYGTGPYGTQSLYSFSTTATYTFGIERSGLQDVYLWWTEHETRQTAVPVRIYDNGTLLATVYVNQKLNGGKWNYIGSYTFSGLAQVRIASTSTTLSTCADAARFVPVVQQPTPPVLRLLL